MGNRAVITTEDRRIGVYLHWNGGRDSVEPLLAFCKAAGYEPPEHDGSGWAHLCTVMCCFFKRVGTVTVDTLDKLDTQGDNGVYIIEGWEIIDRENLYDGYEEQEFHDFATMLEEYNEELPERLKLAPEVLAEVIRDHKKNGGANDESAQ